MSSLLGSPGDRFPLDRAVDELSASARWAGKPSLIWLAGIFYPNLLLNIEAVRTLVRLFEQALGRDLGLPLLMGQSEMKLPLMPVAPVQAESTGELLALTLLWILPALLVYRLNVGLAAVAAPEAGRSEPRTLRAVWHAGRGLAVHAFGMWVTLIGLFVGAMGFLFGPALLLVNLLSLDAAPGLVTVLVAPVFLLVLGYGVVLLILHMLALHSLAQNRRGVGSALTHAWRLIRAEPWGAVRASLVDLLLHGVVLVAGATLAFPFAHSDAASAAVQGLQALLLGAAGATRAAFWARTYRALGGPLRSDKLPGLAAAALPAAPAEIV
jgi:hypothetical protein